MQIRNAYIVKITYILYSCNVMRWRATCSTQKNIYSKLFENYFLAAKRLTKSSLQKLKIISNTQNNIASRCFESGLTQHINIEN